MSGVNKLLLFGGTFDPPHYGHFSLLKAAMEAVAPDLVLVMPTGTPPHKGGEHTSPALRCTMCECFLTLGSNVQIDTREIERGGKSYTIDTVRALREQYTGAHIYLPMGSDMLLTFTQWRDWRALLGLVTLVAHSRRDADLAPVRAYADKLRALGGDVILAEGEVEELSSTEIRALAARGEPIDALVPPMVERIVERHHLYQQPKEESL